MKTRIEFYFMTMCAALLLIVPAALFVDGLIWTLTGTVRFWRLGDSASTAMQFALAFMGAIFSFACFATRPHDDELEEERRRAEAKRQARRPQMPQPVPDFPIGFESHRRDVRDVREQFERESG